MSHFHAVVWIDHSDAHVFHFTPEDVEKSTAHAGGGHPHMHHKRGSVGSGHAGAPADYLHKVVELLQGAQEILVVGPGSAKLELIRHMHRHDHATESRVMGVETVDHPSDGQLLAYARKYFKARDRMIDQGGHGR